MDNKEKIIDLLQKSDENKLSQSEKHELELLIGENTEAKEFADAYTKIRKAIRSGSHLSYDQLYNYILLKSGNEPEDRHVVAQLPLIEDHLRKCEKCMLEFTVLNDEYAEIDSFISEPVTASEAPPARKQVPVRRTPVASRYGIYVVMIIGFLYLGLYFVSEVSSPDYFKYASINDGSDLYITRGRASSEFQRSLQALERQEYSSAISYLEKDIKNHPGDANIFYSHYILGLTYLETSENTVLGLFPSYDKGDVNKGLEHFHQTIKLNSSGKYPNINFDSYFYIAKGNLMLANKDEAKKYLRLVVDNKGSKIQEAQNILSELE